MPRQVFVLDENVMIWATALSAVEYGGGRYQRVGGEYLSALRLLLLINANGHSLAFSSKLWGRCQRHSSMLGSSGIKTVPRPLDVIVQMWHEERVVSVPHPPVVTLPNFPPKDRYLAHLAIATQAMLVTEDEGVLAAAEGGALGFESATIADALQRARAPE